jgi:hypothetical protein
MRMRRLAGGLLSLAILGCEAPETGLLFPRRDPADSKYRITLYYDVSSTTYFADRVTYEGPWVRFFDKNTNKWKQVTGTVEVEGAGGGN